MMWWNKKHKSIKTKLRPAATVRRSRGSSKVVRARFDVAQTTTDNTRHWANADSLSANAAASPTVRRIIRSRARYEVSNNSYAKGIVSTLANDLVGTGPRLQLLTKNDNANRYVERVFSEWAKEIRLAAKLRTMRMARAQDGEAFAILSNNENLRSPVKLDIRLVEADQITTPNLEFKIDRTNAVDGIVFDRFGNPREYHVLKNHPGNIFSTYNFGEYDRFPAEVMIHWFRADRPDQSRGIPDITPALPLFGQLRRYTLAVIAAAETAADFAAVVYTKNAPDETDDAAASPMDVIELEKRMATFLPEGYELGQVKSEQPTTTYPEFKKEILNEIARCMNMPFNVAAGNSSGYNYASGRLDHQTYFKSISVDRCDMEIVVLDRILRTWIDEAVLIQDFIPPGLRSAVATFVTPKHKWFWDGVPHVDPAKEATAQSKRLDNRTTTLASEFALQGKDWEVELKQIAKEQEMMKSLGLITDQKSLAASAQHKGDEVHA